MMLKSTHQEKRFIQSQVITTVAPLNNQQKYDPRWDDFAIALKTGSEVALQRVPIQLVTFLSDVRNKIIIGDGPNITVGDYEMIDVYTNLYNDSSSSLNKRAANALSPDTNSTGWKSDAHKNLPGFKELYKRFPNAKWYFMIDDDTYLIKHNLEQLLGTYDHTKNHYFGQSNVFTGCDGVRKFGEGPTFAHGGTGIILSNGAIKTMLSAVDNCIIKYKSCWAGDVRTALCLRDVGILLKGFSGFHKEPPISLNGIPPCQKPYTFHHLLIKQIQEIWDAESETLRRNKGPISFSDIYNKLKVDGGMEYMIDTDMPGHDIKNQVTPDATSCKELCIIEEKCVSYSYVEGKCWLKDGIVQSKERKGAVSGFLQEKFVCKI